MRELSYPELTYIHGGNNCEVTLNVHSSDAQGGYFVYENSYTGDCEHLQKQMDEGYFDIVASHWEANGFKVNISFKEI